MQPAGDHDEALSKSWVAVVEEKNNGSRKRRTRWSLLVAQYSGVYGGTPTSGSASVFGAGAREMRHAMGGAPGL